MTERLGILGTMTHSATSPMLHLSGHSHDVWLEKKSLSPSRFGAQTSTVFRLLRSVAERDDLFDYKQTLSKDPTRSLALVCND